MYESSGATFPDSNVKDFPLSVQKGIVIGKPICEKYANNGYDTPSQLNSILKSFHSVGLYNGVMIWEFPYTLRQNAFSFIKSWLSNVTNGLPSSSL